MFCNFCGKNFDASEGSEEFSRSGHHLVRCEKCVYQQREEEYDWRTEMYGRGHLHHTDKRIRQSGWRKMTR